jgi:hypothetical protein
MTLDGRDRYFAWYNLGTNLVTLGDFAGASQAYDQAFAINAGLPEMQRLYRMLWYQVGPYEAYYYAGRFQDVLDLGNATLAWVGKPVLEETYYWMGMARQATGDMDKAVKNYTRAAELNPNYDHPRERWAIEIVYRNGCLNLFKHFHHRTMRKRVTTLQCHSFCLLMAFAYQLPPIHSRLSWRVDELRTRIKYAINPPDEAVFIPGGGSPPGVRTITQTPAASPTSTLPGPTETPLPSPTPTIPPTPLPKQVRLEGVKYEDQHGRWNYCGPANLSMALTFWGWEGDRDVVGKAIKPNDDDKNIMPYEMQDFVQANAPGLDALVRLGGDIDLLKRMVAGGFPVVAERVTTSTITPASWAGWVTTSLSPATMTPKVS